VIFDRWSRISLPDLFIQETINGLNLGAMCALLALGFTLIYGIRVKLGQRVAYYRAMAGANCLQYP
jgi:hypothetical protein